MNDQELRSQLVAIVRSVAPELQESDITDSAPLRDLVDLDSMDWLRVILGVHEKLHVDIPEADYGKLRALDDWVAYLRTRIPS